MFFDAKRLFIEQIVGNIAQIGDAFFFDQRLERFRAGSSTSAKASAPSAKNPASKIGCDEASSFDLDKVRIFLLVAEQKIFLNVTLFFTKYDKNRG